MDAKAQQPITGDPKSVQERRQEFADRVALQLKRMDEALENPGLTPEQRYAIVSPLLIWFE